MSYTKYPKGSEWRKWDLHVHTPFTKINDQYNVNSGEDKWDRFCDKVEESDVMVFGITDYFSVENYFTFIDKFNAKYPSSKKVFFPNIELRLEVSVGRDAKEVNIHVIFSDSVQRQNIESFLLKLNTSQSINGASVPCKNLSSKSDFESATVDYKNLGNILVEVFGNNVCYLIVAASNDLRPDRDGSPRKQITSDEIDKVCDAFFSCQQESVQYYLKTDRYENDELAKQKPVISGCDAHSFDNLENYLGKRVTRTPDNGNVIIEKDITWIKADPTFDGLMQIIYEPKDRVKIQEEKPDEKKPYSVIDTVRFLDQKDTPEFSNEWIQLNPNLNSIIGGKSSGKSLLLYHMAKTIDSERIEEINKEKEYKKLEYRFEKENAFDFEVKWADGEAYKLKDSNKPNRPITYIPQLYLNRLAEDKKDELNSLVENMLLESNNEYKEFRDEQGKQIEQSKSELSKYIGNYYRTKQKLADNEEEHKKLGDKKAVENNIKETTKKIDTLRAESKFSDKEEIDYKALQEKLIDTKDKVDKSEEIIEIVEFGQSELQKLKDKIEEIFVEEILQEAKDRFPTSSSGATDKLAEILKKFSADIAATIDNNLSTEFAIIGEETTNKNSLKEVIKGLNKSLEPFNEKMKHKDKFEALQKEKLDEVTKLKGIKEKETEIEILKEKLSKEQSLFIEKHKSFFDAYLGIVKENEKYSEIPDAKMTLSSGVKIKRYEFDQNFLEKINKKKPLSSQFGGYFNEKNEYLFEPDKHLANTKCMVEKITSGEIEFNKGFEEKGAIYSLLDDHYYIDYDLIKDNDRLVDMSPGKMGIILFQLFLHLSQSDYPILVDQPEDNLDNRTVYKELNDFIKQKKIGRQIIIVSHNANLVVSTDSENIIVANQKGQDSSSDQQSHKFAYVNGAIEYSYVNENKRDVLYKRGIREHVCEILEGGKEAFEKRENKYGFRVQ